MSGLTKLVLVFIKHLLPPGHSFKVFALLTLRTIYKVGILLIIIPFYEGNLGREIKSFVQGYQSPNFREPMQKLLSEK